MISLKYQIYRLNFPSPNKEAIEKNSKFEFIRIFEMKMEKSFSISISFSTNNFIFFINQMKMEYTINGWESVVWLGCYVITIV